MQKITLLGPTITGFNNQENLTTVYNSGQIETFLDTKAPFAREIFINSHGIEDFSEGNSFSQLYLKLFPEISENSFSKQLAHNVLSKIAQNTEENKPNIVHIFSCHSGAAHHTLQEVKGDIIVCTYAPATTTMRGYAITHIFDIKNKFVSLTDFIVKNLPILTATDFSISYKLGNQIHNLNFDSSSIKTMDMTSFPELLQEQYIKVREFYKKLQEHFSDEYPELFSESDFSEKVFYPDDELKKAFNLILNSDRDDLNLDEIDHLLDMDNLDVEVVLGKAISNRKIDIIEKIIGKVEKINDIHLISVIETWQIDITEKLINKMEKVAPLHFYAAIEVGNIPALEMLIKKNPEQAEIWMLEDAIQQKPLNFIPITELLLNVIKVDIVSETLSNEILIQAIKTHNPSLVQKVMSIGDIFNIFSSVVKVAIDEGNLIIIKILLEHTPFNPLIRAVNAGDLPKVEELLSKMQSVKIEQVASIVLSGNRDMVRVLTHKVGEDTVLTNALKLGNSLVVQNILDEKEKNGTLTKDMDKIFNIAIGVGNVTVIEDVMNKMKEITSGHLMDVIESQRVNKEVIFEKVYDRVEKISSASLDLVLELAISSKNPFIIAKITDKMEEHYLLSNFHKALESDDQWISRCIPSILINRITKIPDEDKYKLLDITAKGNKDGMPNLDLFGEILDKVGEIDEAHLHAYLKLIHPFCPAFKKLLYRTENITPEILELAKASAIFTNDTQLEDFLSEKYATQNAIQSELTTPTIEVNTENDIGVIGNESIPFVG